MKITKKPKRTDVIFEIVERKISTYKCPTCKAYYKGTGLTENITRFKCSCGQELIINKFLNKGRIAVDCL